MHVINLSGKWSSYRDTYVRGSAFLLSGRQINGIELAKYVHGFELEEIDEQLKDLNGFFSIVKRDGEKVAMAVDRIRSITLFFAKAKDGYFISDDPYWIKGELAEAEADSESEREMLVTGYVTGRKTLYRGINQLQAGDITLIDRNSADTWQYYKLFMTDTKLQHSKNMLFKKYDDILLSAFKRLICYANGRTIVVPLSGGYDSRLIALMLKRLNYQNVITFTFGMPGNSEAVVSKQVADHLGFKWLFVPYDNDKSYKWYNSNERREYGKMADNLCSICQDREWPAVWELSKNNLLPKDSVVVPGHSGDFIGGQWIPMDLYENDAVDEKQCIDAILKKHYVMLNWKGQEGALREAFHKKIKDCMKIGEIDMSTQAIAACENWDWMERQSKYYTNSIRAYEFWGYDWWLPLWDREFVEYWTHVPLEWRINKNLYNEYVIGLYSEMAGITIHEAAVRNSTVSQKAFSVKKAIKDSVKNTRMGAAMQKKYNKMKKSNDQNVLEAGREEQWDTDWELSFGRMNKNLYDKLQPYIVGRASCMTLERLGYINYTDSELSEHVIEMLKEMKG